VILVYATDNVRLSERRQVIGDFFHAHDSVGVKSNAMLKNILHGASIAEIFVLVRSQLVDKVS